MCRLYRMSGSDGGMDLKLVPFSLGQRPEQERCVGAVALFSGFVPKDAQAKLPKKWDSEADVVVVGAGGAGLAASLQLASQGRSVILLER